MINMITVENHQKIRVSFISWPEWFCLIKIIAAELLRFLPYGWNLLDLKEEEGILSLNLSSRSPCRLLSADCPMVFVKLAERDLTSQPAQRLTELVSGNLTQVPAKRVHKKKLTHKVLLTGLNADSDSIIKTLKIKEKVDNTWKMQQLGNST